MSDVSASIETTEDIGKQPQSVVKRWKIELALANKREDKWRKRVKAIYDIYAPEEPKLNSFNILWTNTETLRQSVYNSVPQPDVRRRYQDEDQLGKEVSTVLMRALEFSQDTYDFDGLLKSDVLSMLLCGRSVSRVKYVPDIRQVGGDDENGVENDAGTDEESQETYEEIEWEQTICERIQWDDFRILCAAKTWDEVNAVGFRHRLTREQCIDKFGEEIGNKIPLNDLADEEVNKSKIANLFKTAEIWEIWDKEDKKVNWICTDYDVPCKIQDDPLELQGFFPIPKPLYAIENDTTLVPTALYTQYEQQAKELNRISGRINKIVDTLKVRGIYDETIDALSRLQSATDGQLVPSGGVTALIERGGLERAIWMMPIDQAANVLKELYVQRDATKQVIYEITGISDIMRAASDPNETFGAQKIKTQWGTQRLQRMQNEVQRYIRDLIRLKAEIISEKFQPETLEAMTLVELPHQAQVDQQKQQMAMQYQQAVFMAQQQGQQPPPAPQPHPDPVTWEQVIEAMRNDATRTYRIDIETDSTLSATQDSDMQSIQQGVAAIGQIGQVFGPAVQMGDMDVETLKQLMLAVTRKMKMGSAVEDALNKIKQPQPKGDPNAAKAQSDMQIAQMKMQMDDAQHQRELAATQQLEEFKARLSVQTEQLKQEAQDRQAAHENAMQAAREEQKAELEARLEAQRIEADERIASLDRQLSVLLEHIRNQGKIEVAEISAGSTLEAAQITAAHQGSKDA